MDEKNVKRVLTTFNSTFTNDDVMFIEYHDVLKSPWFVFLSLVHNNGIITEIFDTSSICNYDMDELYEWYINRDYRNIFKNIPLQPAAEASLIKDYGEAVDINKWLDDILNYELEAIPLSVEAGSDLNFMKVASYITHTKSLVKKIYVYTEHYNKNIEKDVKEIFDGKAQYIFGDFKQTLLDNKVPTNSSYVFSDITKIPKLDEVGLLEYSSITLVEKYKYNYDDDDNHLYDIDAFMKEKVFKFTVVDNIHQLIDTEHSIVNFGNDW